MRRSLGLRRGLFAVLGVAAASGAALGCGGDETVSTSTTGSGGSTSTGGTAGTGGGTGGTAGSTGGTGGSTATTGGSGGAMMQVCGDGVLMRPELCDDGNTEGGDGCENDCSFTCTKGTSMGDAWCNDGDPCDGVETCADTHACVATASLPDGTSCGTGKVCKAGLCGDLSCGDAFVDPGEACDDGNLDPADGCDACSFTCVVASDCNPVDVCAGVGVCAANHTCSVQSPLANGASCPGGTCKTGACVVAICGNGTLEGSEACDDGNIVSGDGCQSTCQVTCVTPAADCPAAPACNKPACSGAKTCTTAPDPAKNGSSCGVGLTCLNGACLGAGAVCGNGAVEAGEDCDFGAGNGAGTGCEATCKFSCTKAPDSCVDQNACNGVEACNTVVVGGKSGQKCGTGSAPATCTACGPGVCTGGTCVAATCGDGCVEANKGESCEPPNQATCDSACHTKVCGNGARETGEDCDDGNTTNLDGCSADCHFEQLQRIRYLVLQYATDAFCSNNQLGAAVVGGAAQGQLQGSIEDGIQSGAIDVLMQFLLLGDLTGTSDPMLQIGTMNGVPKKQGQPYDGAADLDFWHTVDASTVDANKVPLAIMPAQVAAKALTAGPGSMSLSVSFGGPPAQLALSQVKLAITLGAASTPLVSSGNPPGHLGSEHLDPALVSFAGAGQSNANGAGKLCGNVSAASLAAVPIPAQLTMGGFGCAEGYSAQNSMLDVIVGGCTIFTLAQIAKKQPDQVDPAAPVGGAGAPYTFVADAQHAITSCTDKNGADAPLAECLNAAAYSSFFKLATNRVIAK